MVKRVNLSFYKLFEFDDASEVDDMQLDFYYSFFYWRQSPRGSIKFGITHLPWERLRMQQQGTDESIQFDHLWMAKSPFGSFVSIVEDGLKRHFKARCLHNVTKRAGHTEWYTGVDVEDFKAQLSEILDSLNSDGYYRGEVKKIKLHKPYTATKSSECPFKSPSNSRFHSKRDINDWARSLWNKLP